jgi:4'-phosphopantetheinyl transferase
MDDRIVHVVALDLTAMADDDAAANVLDSAERRRAASFAFDRDRRRYVAAHVLLRHTLAWFLDASPAALRMTSGPSAKPRLASAPRDVRFSLSHAGDRALLAVTTGREVGIDLELMRPDPDLAQVARLFSPAEQGAIAALPMAARARAFLQCWTRKESFVKAIGAGLSFPLQGFTVSLEPGPRRLVACPAAPDQLERWMLTELQTGPATVAALTVEGEDWRVEEWRTNWRARGGFAVEPVNDLLAP